MGTSIHRVVVRGQFDGLSDDQRADLLAEADDHEIFKATYTEWGSFTYDRALVAFQLRYEVRLDPAASPADGTAPDPVEIGLAKARAQLAEWGLPAKHLRATATDMTAMWSSR